MLICNQDPGNPWDGDRHTPWMINQALILVDADETLQTPERLDMMRRILEKHDRDDGTETTPAAPVRNWWRKWLGGAS